jgi:hypothetical protein
VAPEKLSKNMKEARFARECSNGIEKCRVLRIQHVKHSHQLTSRRGFILAWIGLYFKVDVLNSPRLGN